MLTFPNGIEYIWYKSQFYICNYECARILFVDSGLNSKLQHYGTCKSSWKKLKKLCIQIIVITLKMILCRTMSKKQNWKKVKTQESMDKTNFIFLQPTLQPSCNSSHMVACRSSSENTWKMNLQSILSKNSLQAHTESEFDILGVAKNLWNMKFTCPKQKVD